MQYKRVIAPVSSKSHTLQSEAESANINSIVAKMQRGIMPNFTSRNASYGDFSGITCYQDAIEQVQATNKSFMLLPAAVRLKFGNNPQALFEFLDNPENRPEAISLGLIDKPVEMPPNDVKSEMEEVVETITSTTKKVPKKGTLAQ